MMKRMLPANSFEYLSPMELEYPENIKELA